MVLLGERKENHLGELVGRYANPIPELLTLIFLIIHPLLKGNSDLASWNLELDGKLHIIYLHFLSRTRNKILNLRCLKTIEINPDRQI